MKARAHIGAFGAVALLCALPAVARLLPRAGQPLGACAVPVEVVEGGRARLVCDGGRAALGSRACAEPARAGDRIVLGAEGCRVQTMAAGPRLALGLRVDLNRASLADLASLPGVGPVLAERILAERAAGGPFVALADLDRVPGVGRGLTEALGAVAFVGER